MTNNVVNKTIQSYEVIANDYSKSHSDILEVKGLADFFIQNLKGKSVLDVGCGPGRDAKYFSEKGSDVVGIDLTPNFIKIASENVSSAKFLLMDMCRLDFPNDFFDGVWCCASFLHIPKIDAKSALLGFKRVLKPSGLIYVSVKGGYDEGVVKSTIYSDCERFFAFYSEQEIVSLFKDCGFDILSVSIDRKKDEWINVFAIKS